LSHAQAGEEWLRRYLEKMGKTEGDLAKRLWDENWTAIAEVYAITAIFHRISFVIYIFSCSSYVMTHLKSMSSRIRQNVQVSISMVSMFPPKPFKPCHTIS